MAEDMNITEEQVREEARIYRKEAKRPLSSYQKKMNDAAEQICLENPSMLRKRSDLVEAARSRIIEEGFQFKKGKSRSKKLTTSEPRSKRIKLTQQVRQTRMKNVEEDIGDIKDRISFKEKRRYAAEAIRDYKKCDEITEELTHLKHKKRELEDELKALKSKEQQSKRYKDRSNSQKSNSSTEAVISDTDNSSRSSTPLPHSNSSVDQSPMLSPVEIKQPFLGSDSVPFAMHQIEILDGEKSPEVDSPNKTPKSDDTAIVIHDTSSTDSNEEILSSQQQSSNAEYQCFENVTVSDSDQGHGDSF